MYGHPDVQDAAVRLLLIRLLATEFESHKSDLRHRGLWTAFWRVLADCVLRLLGHKNDEVVKDVLTLFTPLAQGHQDDEDLDDLDEASEDRLLRLAKSMLSEANRLRF